MADIERYLRAILEATFGEQVRGSIHDAIEVMNVESEGSRADASAAQQSASVVENAFTVTNGLMDQARTWHDEWEEVVGNINYGIYPMGPATVATLPLEPNVGWMYYMTQPDVTDDRFLEGAGVELLLNQKVYFTNKGKWSIMVADGLLKTVQDNTKNITEIVSHINTMATWESYIIEQSLWNTDDKTYSLENEYPSDEYDILEVMPAMYATYEQINAWNRCECTGYNDQNVLLSRADIPIIDIPVKMLVYRKELTITNGNID